MSASGRTDYFAIPIYEAGDTCEYIPSYNNGMTIIDAQMQQNKQTGMTNTSRIATHDTAIQNAQNEIAELQVQVNKQGEYLQFVPANNVANKVNKDNAGFLGITDKVVYLNLEFGLSESYQFKDAPVLVKVNTLGLIPTHTIEGNPLNLPEGASNFRVVSHALITSTGSIIRHLATCVWCVGGVTNIGLGGSADATTEILGGLYNCVFPIVTPDPVNFASLMSIQDDI